MSDPVIRRSQSQLAGARGHALHRRAWLPREPERVLLLVHGYGEHSGRYEPLGSWLAARGSAVHAYDHQGHGSSSGARCHVRRFDDFLDDLEQVRRKVASEHPGLPLYAVGHSMGGLIVAAWASERQPPVSGVVTSGAALALAQGAPRGQLRLARLLRWVAPRLSLPANLDLEGLCSDPEVVRAYLADPLVQDKMTLSLAAELSRAIERTARGAASVRVPMLLLHGEDDTLCPVQGSRTFHAALRVEGCDIRTYPGLRHEIFNEPARERVYHDLLDWLQKRGT